MGDPCGAVTRPCAPGLECIRGSCVPGVLPDGEVCDSSRDCADGLYCATQQGSGFTCVRKLAAGASCTGLPKDACHGDCASDSGKCVAICGSK